MPRHRHRGPWIVSSNYAGFRSTAACTRSSACCSCSASRWAPCACSGLCSFALVHARREASAPARNGRRPSVAVDHSRLQRGKGHLQFHPCAARFARQEIPDHRRRRRLERQDRRGRARDVRARPRASACSPSPTRASGRRSTMALAHTDAEIIVTLDADTLFEPDALPLLVRHFEDPNVGAVAGSAVVGNRVNLITRFQALEYVTNQNLDRRALEVVNGITVVPGRHRRLAARGAAGDRRIPCPIRWRRMPTPPCGWSGPAGRSCTSRARSRARRRPRRSRPS